ncbi:MAG TPA: hypothetical protein VEQ10_00110 [Vicinamibacteria bacterium]|nr:hypothetical protein [Vicinamibacteria bacterium]
MIRLLILAAVLTAPPAAAPPATAQAPAAPTTPAAPAPRPSGPPDVVQLTNGDQVSGHVVGSITRRVRLQTPYGLLVIPRASVARIQRGDGSVELVSAPAPEKPKEAPPPPPAPEPARLHLVIRGDTFWQAWDPKAAPADPSLRLEVSLDDRPVASYVDSTLDPEDLPKAVVNSFVFSPEALAVHVTEGVVAGPPVVVPGEIGLPLRVPADLAGVHRLRLSYEVDDGTTAAPQWRELVTGSSEIVLSAGGTTVVKVVQSRGTMEYSHKRMHNVETFSARVAPETARAAVP